ncbi:phytoene desaturase family protein [Desulfotomaculum copahuensis]|uniref:phytoene desaturase family protein n=1 Tax=Desulfotomaculum copahuensis TaxID=1838280 RepID=UPI000ABCB201|nr:NAD(P)/FAD-dependent oxidoreductase [Desulfotomaculum copahuensis]
MNRHPEEAPPGNETAYRPDAGRGRGMANILPAFVPWILYWVLPAPWGLTGGLAVSLILFWRLWRRRQQKIMDGFTAAFFLLAAGLVFLLHAAWFIRWQNVLAFAALAAMALFSLLAGSPFTLQYAREDWPPQLWTEPLFVATNIHITLAWTVAFTYGAVMAIILPAGPWRLLYLHPGTLAALAFTIIWPRFYPRRAIAIRLHREKSLRPQWENPDFETWRAIREEPFQGTEICRLPDQDANGTEPAGAAPTGGLSAPLAVVHRVPSRDRFDVIVIGAGIGGLTAAARLADRGLKVCVLEKQHQPGGYCTSFVRKGYTFDGGVESISGCGPNGPVTLLLEELGVRQRIRFHRHQQRYCTPMGTLDIPDNYISFTNLLVDLAPQEEEGIRTLMAELEAAYHQLYQDVKSTGGIPGPPGTVEEALRYPRTHPDYYLATRYTWGEYIRRRVRDTFIFDILTLLTAYLGDRGPDTPAAAMIPLMGYYIEGGVYPAGGSQRLADVLADAVRERGGEVRLNSPAGRIILKEGRVAGIYVHNDTCLVAPVVISNADPRQTFFQLVGKENLPRPYTGRVEKLRPSPSAFALYMALDRPSGLPERTFVQPAGRLPGDSLGIGGFVLISNAALDPELAPPGAADLTMITLTRLSAEHCACMARQDYLAFKEQLTRIMLDYVEEVAPGIKEHIVHAEAATPRTFYRYTWNTAGAIYGLEPETGAQGTQWLDRKTPIPGLWLTGASAWPGPGIEAVVISGTAVADEIMPRKIKKVHP